MWRAALQISSLRQLSNPVLEHAQRCTAAIVWLRNLQEARISTSAAATAESSASSKREESSASLKREAGTALRFYKNAGIQQVPAEEGGSGGYGVTLDGKRVKTPARQPLVLPSLPLALAIAAEWEYQDARALRPFTMPLMGLAATAIDQPRPREEVISTLLQYLDHDALCCRHEPGAIADRQALIYDPIIVWASNLLGAQLNVEDSLFGGRQTEDVHAGARKYLQGLDVWHLTAVDSLASACKSVVAGIALGEGRLSVDGAVHATRIEEDMQIEEWGLVEGGHDIDIADARARIGGATVFLKLVNMHTAG